MCAQPHRSAILKWPAEFRSHAPERFVKKVGIIRSLQMHFAFFNSRTLVDSRIDDAQPAKETPKRRSSSAEQHKYSFVALQFAVRKGISEDIGHDLLCQYSQTGRISIVEDCDAAKSNGYYQGRERHRVRHRRTWQMREQRVRLPMPRRAAESKVQARPVRCHLSSVPPSAQCVRVEGSSPDGPGIFV
jgi:hypothetical protein